MSAAELITLIQQHVREPLQVSENLRDEATMTIAPAQLVAVASKLLQEPALAFELLVDVTAVDHQERQSARFEVIYHLFSPKLASYLRLKVPLQDTGDDTLPVVPTVCHLWSAANWLERETYDMFGIHFEGHPNLKRILMTESMQGYPLRKDFPLHGYPEWPVQHSRKRRIKKDSGNAN